MRYIVSLLVLAVTSFANAQGVAIQCRIFENRKLVAEQTVTISQRETTIADLGEYLVQITTDDTKNFSLNALDRYEEIRTYAEARLLATDDRLALAMWKRSGLFEVECRRLANRRIY